MILINLEMLPHGFQKGKQNLGTIRIWNNGTGTLSLGNYNYKVTKGNKVKIEGQITGFARKREDVFALLHLVLKDIYKSK